MTDHRQDIRRGYGAALAAYSAWGLLPIYFKLVAALGPLEIVAHRVLWSMALLLVLIVARGRLAALRASFSGRVIVALVASAVLIAVNWIVYVWAANSGHILAASLGYFLNPLVSVMLGVVFLKERLRRAQMIAAAIATVGAGALAVTAMGSLWISLVLALSFGFYGLIRKVTPVDALSGLAVETMLLGPVALAYLVVLGPDAGLGSDSAPGLWGLVALSGVITSVPLLLFGYAARRLSLAAVGLLQYIAPSMQFLLGLIVYNEPLDPMRLASFVIIWAGLAVFAHDAVRTARAAREGA